VRLKWSTCFLIAITSCIEVTAPSRGEIACIEVAKPSLTIEANGILPKNLQLKVDHRVLLNECKDVTRSVASHLDVEKTRSTIKIYGEAKVGRLVNLQIRDCRKRKTLFSGELKPQFQKKKASSCNINSEKITPAKLQVTL